MTTNTIHPVQTLLRPGSLAHRIAWRIQGRAAIKVLLVLLTLSLFGWFYLTVATTTADLNSQIEAYQTDIENLTSLNSEIEIEIARQQSLQVVELRAKEIGLAPSDPALSVYLPADGYPVVEASNVAASR